LPLDGYFRPAWEPRWACAGWLASGGFTGCEDAILLGVVSRTCVASEQMYFLAVLAHGWCGVAEYSAELGLCEVGDFSSEGELERLGQQRVIFFQNV
jgi:hypothetical protein